MSKHQWSEEFCFVSINNTQEELEWKLRFITEVEKESSRGVVLTVVSFIDELLIKILAAYFPNKKHANKLLENLDGCLSTIMYRTNIAFSLALLRECEYKSISILARIRNEFAHKWDGTDFENKTINKLINSFPQEYFKDIGGSNKAKFNRVASDIIQELLKKVTYSENLCKSLPKEYRDIFDLTDEERRQLINCEIRNKQ